MADLARLQSDPLRNFKFKVSIGRGTGWVNMGFMSVSGLSTTIDVIPYREGGFNTTPHKLPGQADFPPVTFSKGLAVGDKAMMDWLKELFDVTTGSGSDPAPGNSTNDYRTTAQIDIFSHPAMGGFGTAQASFKLYNAWPQSVSFSDLDAGANAVVVQQMVLVHEGFQFNINDQLSNTSVKLNTLSNV